MCWTGQELVLLYAEPDLGFGLRSTPMPDEAYGGQNDLAAALAYEVTINEYST